MQVIRDLAMPMCVAALVALAGSAEAKPRVKVSTETYQITGNSVAELKAAMEEHGPDGYWAQTFWGTNWEGNCQVIVEISFTYPEWAGRESADADLREKWDAMMVALKRHEGRHAEHGINAGIEIEKAKCGPETPDINGRWGDADQEFDAKTDHGKLEGVVLE